MITGKQCKAIRKSLDMTQEHFWRLFGVTQSGGCRYERGRSIPKPVKILLTSATKPQALEGLTAVHKSLHKALGK